MVRYTNCYVCDIRTHLQITARLALTDIEERTICINRREALGSPARDIVAETRVCFNCHQNVLHEIELQGNPLAVRLNVSIQSRNNTCLICEADDGIQRLSGECKADIFLRRNIFMPPTIRVCVHHLDRQGYLLQPLLQGLRSINRPYLLQGQDLQIFLQGMRSVSPSRNRFQDENCLNDAEFYCLTSLTKPQFEDMFTHCDRLPRDNGFRYVNRKDLMMFLCKMRQGLSDEFLSLLFDYSSRQATSLAVATVRESLMQRFVPENIGFGAITRQQYIEQHVSDFADCLFNNDRENRPAIFLVDATYTYCHKSMNFRALRQTYCLHKGRHLVKPGLILAPDGYIVEIEEPTFSDAHNNDAEMLRDDIENNAAGINGWMQEGDIIVSDRGYRNIRGLLEELGLISVMPAFLERGERQLSTEDANASRIVTIIRWMVEARNGHLKSIFKFLGQVMQMQHLPNLGDFYRIAGAIINRYHPPLTMEGADAERADVLLARAQQANDVQRLVEENNLATRNAQRWVRLDARQLHDFPVLNLEFLEDFTTGPYQIELAPSYVQDKLQRDGTDEFQFEMLRDGDRLPEPGLLRVRVFSRFRNAAKHQLWVSYTPTDAEGRAVDGGYAPIRGCYCTCRSGARTLGTCAHVTSVVWYLGYARHQDHVKYPSQILLNSIRDAAHRGPQENPA